ncbi:hypothetical protein [Winogradskyella immobilis]|uniref:Lipoprotein n=1 Tax=Winogradskyella immobilis TaxID=2816852 RepID=A0ABS8EJ39_9FLAO|nr:hypothetical protein [Winogradskyella immobilis]MCC1483220.1 hypothetical protein [Winogradskyella immobilis]MCG0015314.1 hypothetical protein [Winogradskyella immobilis]
MRVTLLVFCIYSILFNSCSNTDDEPELRLPPITQTGANTFGCLIDGQLLIPRDGSGSTLGPDSGMSFISLGEFPNYLYNEISVRDFKSGNGELLDIHFVDLHQNGEGIYNVKESNCQDNVDANPSLNIRSRIWDENEQIFRWYCSIEDSGTLTITRYDSENRIVSGTFNCIVQNRDDPNDFIEITQGRFDIKWDTLADTSFP